MSWPKPTTGCRWSARTRSSASSATQACGPRQQQRRKRGPSGQNRTADEPGQTLNGDLCFVPATHEQTHRLPAVSGSSGQLVISGPRDRSTEQEHSWPGQVFEDAACAYETAMRTFVLRSAPRTPLLNPEREEQRQRHGAPDQVAIRELRRQERALALRRGQRIEQRKREDAAWRALCQERRERERPYHWTAAHWAAYLAAEDQWRAMRAQTSWIAILVLTDNCTRQCLGLPLFVAGAKVTADLVIAALRALLPADLQFLISDRGVHFTAHQFARLAKEQDFVHVLIARHRPESNGIAERFVRTLKEWLADRAWIGAEALEMLLEQFRAEYNDRPHQGLAIPGLSPDEFAARFWLL
jgi:transposase InsO family protein